MSYKSKIGIIVILSLFSIVAVFSTAAAAEYNWKFSSFLPASHKSLGLYQKWWANQIEMRSQGKIKVKIYWSRQLCGTKEMMSAVKSGLADVVCAVPIYTPGETPIGSMTYLPFIRKTGAGQTVNLYNKFAEQNKAFQAEMAKFNCVYGAGWDSTSNQLISKRPIKTVADLKGLRIRSLPDLGKIFAEYGGVPVSIPVTEMYTSLDRGMLDSVVFPYEGFRTWKLHEIAKYLTVNMDMGGVTAFFFINKDSWNALPEDLKQVVKSVALDAPGYVSDLMYELGEKATTAYKEKGIEIINLPAEEKKKLEDKAPTYWDAWAKRTGQYEAAKAALADYMRIRDELLAN